MKDGNIRDMVSALVEVSKEFGQTEQLRERIRGIVIGEMNERSKLEKELYEALQAAQCHLEYCGYGDSWERECASEQKLEQKIQNALRAYEAAN